MYIDTISIKLPILYLKASHMKISIIANSAGPDEIPDYLSFHLGLQCLPKYPFTGIHNEKC